MYGGGLGVSTSVSPVLASSAELFLQDRQYHEEQLIRALMYAQPISVDRDLFDKVKRGKVHMFSSIKDWQERLSHLDMFVGVRVHGAICALNSGVPAVVMNADSRAREMCEFLNIPYMPDLLHSADLAEIWARADYEKMNREYALKYQIFKSFMLSNGVQIVDFRADNGEDKQPSAPLVSSSVRLLQEQTIAAGAIDQLSSEIGRKTGAAIRNGRRVSYRLGKWLTKQGKRLMERTARERREA